MACKQIRPQGRCICGADLADAERIWVSGRPGYWAWQCMAAGCWDETRPPQNATNPDGGRVWQLYRLMVRHVGGIHT